MSFGCEFFVGTLVERLLEDLSFPAKILAVQPSNHYRLTYLDDGNVEDNVPGDELRAPSPKDLLKYETLIAPEKPSMIVAKAGGVPPLLVGKDSKTLDPDSVANLTMPKVLLHDELYNAESKNDDNSASDSASVLNGEAGIAVPRGGGLRALRALRK